MAKRKKKNRLRQGKEITPSKAQEVTYRRRLLAIVSRIERLIKRKLIPELKRLEPEFTADSKASARKKLIQILNSLNKQAQQTDKNAFKWANSYVGGTNKANEIRNFNALKRTTGIDLKKVIMNEGIKEGLKTDIDLNVKLIKSIPDVYFKRLNKIFENALLKEQPAASLIQQITALGHSTKARAKFIARDQTATISAKLNERRQQNLGAIGYKWIHSQDRRVRGSSTPGGIYKNSQYDHWERGGHYYYWKRTKKKTISPDGTAFRQPPQDGNPGEPIGCRCTAIPVFA